MALVDTFGKLTFRKLTISTGNVLFIRNDIFNDCQNSTHVSALKSLFQSCREYKYHVH
jgi:hypothetical protein